MKKNGSQINTKKSPLIPLSKRGKIEEHNDGILPWSIDIAYSE
jgi:hypothetical protein